MELYTPTAATTSASSPNAVNRVAPIRHGRYCRSRFSAIVAVAGRLPGKTWRAIDMISTRTLDVFSGVVPTTIVYGTRAYAGACAIGTKYWSTVDSITLSRRTSFETPMTEVHGAVGDEMRTHSPIGSRFPQMKRAVGSVTTMTSGAPSRSPAVNGRPSMIGTPVATKYSGVTAR